MIPQDRVDPRAFFCTGIRQADQNIIQAALNRRQAIWITGQITRILLRSLYNAPHGKQHIQTRAFPKCLAPLNQIIQQGVVNAHHGFSKDWLYLQIDRQIAALKPLLNRLADHRVELFPAGWHPDARIQRFSIHTACFPDPADQVVFPLRPGKTSHAGYGHIGHPFCNSGSFVMIRMIMEA